MVRCNNLSSTLSDVFDVIICHLLSPAQIRDGIGNTFTLLKNAWDEKIRRLGRVLHAPAPAVKLLPVPISFLGYRHSDAHRAMETIANIASRTANSFHCARTTLFQRHTAPLMANIAVCLMSGFDFEVLVLRLEIKHDIVAYGNIFVPYPLINSPIH